MTELFLNTLNRSISASWLVLAVLALRILLKKAPKWVPVLLWGMVAVRLLCPVSIESAVSLVPSAQTVRPEIMMDWKPQVDTGVPVLDSVVNPVVAETFTPQPGASVNPLQIWISICAWLWLMGAAGLLLYTVVSYWLLRRKVAAAVLLRYNVYRSDRVAAPFVLGILRPRIYLPHTLSREALVYVVAHEKAHIRRKDHWWKPLGFLLLTVHWFNPLMWLAYKLLSRDIELACDEYVIESMNNHQRADYAQALLDCSVSRPAGMACPIAFGEVGVKTRIKSVMNYKKPRFWIILVALIACALFAVCFLTNPKEAEIRNTVQGNMRTYHEMTDGTWLCDGVFYEQRLERKGRLPNAATDTVYVYLSNVDITFEQAYKATLSSHTKDFFKAEDAILVEMWSEEPQPVAAPGESNPTESEIPAAEAVAPVHHEVADLAWFMELSAFEKEFQEMSPERKAAIIPEYGGLLDGFDLIARESTDGELSYIVGYWGGNVEESPLYHLLSSSIGDENGEMQVLYDERDLEATDKYEEPEYKYAIHNSHINNASKTGYFLIHPTDSGWGFNDVFNKYLRPNGREYMQDAFSRGIALATPEGAYLEVSLISPQWGEIYEMIPLSEAQVSQIIAEDRQKIETGYGFAARLEPGPNAALNLDSDALYYTEFRGVPQTVLDLAIEKCGYKFAAPQDIRSDIVEARLDCDWLAEPRYVEEADLPQLQRILTNAEFGYVGKCGYGARLTIRMADGSEMVLFKGTDSCDTLVFGSYGGYFIGDAENLQFWTIFGLDPGSKQPLG